MDLVTIEEIRQLKYRYLRNLDLKRWDDFADTLTPDVTASYGENLSFGSRDEVVAFMREMLGPAIITVHHCHHPEIEVDGDRAAGIWHLDDTVIITEHRMLLRGAAFYEDSYVRCDDGRWRISKTGYRRTYEATLSLDDVPSFQLTANRWVEPATQPAAE
ncbi:nuclear transport factor 2 family protein [Gandjariella thermophila]|uniref:Bile-acid 7-alpha-dehydratase n=1 Tax=Gandjariella thermophila TaxID=1931992 RepID=A0A4D4J505_9PSEU|nr:nuclear transport factor 2 family protein [Gandjariella thermophila]GDY29616.1 bile-acid 7-alpha-dehydratase [Gandjariella thermophila]